MSGAGLSAHEDAKALVSKGAALARLGSLEAALACYDDVIERFVDDRALALREQVAAALVNKGAALGQIASAIVEEPGARGPWTAVRQMMARPPRRPAPATKAMAVYDRVVELYGEDPAPTLRAWVAKALLIKGAELWQAERFADAVEAYDQVLERFGEDPALAEQPARALGSKGAALWQLDRRADSDTSYTLLADRFARHPVAVVREQVAASLVRHAVVLVRWDLKRSEDAIAVCDKVIDLFDKDAAPALREWVAKALLVKAITLGRLRRFDEAVTSYNRVVELFGEDPAPGLIKEVATAVSGRISLLGR